MTRADLDKQPAAVARMFDVVAPRYDLMNDLLSMGQDRSWRRATVRAVGAKPGERVLDLAAGTGTSSREFADVGARVVACDLSEGMVAEGRRRHPDVPFVVGDGTRLPFASSSFEAVTISFGLRNVPDVPAALAEMLRVTVPGGRIVICEFSTPTLRPFAAVYRAYLELGLPRVARLVSSNPEAYAYLGETIEAWPAQRELARMMLQAGWRRAAYRNLSGGIVALHRAVKPQGPPGP